MRIGLGGLVAAALLTACSSTSGQGSAPDEDTVDAIDAEIFCERFVERELNAPSTADFTSDGASGGPTEWTVRGRVEADTPAGGRTGARYRCDLVYEGDGQWRLTNDRALRE